jgi:hypothetical protein
MIHEWIAFGKVSVEKRRGAFFCHPAVCHCSPENNRFTRHCLQTTALATVPGKQCFSTQPTSRTPHGKQWHTQHLSPPEKLAAREAHGQPASVCYDNIR